LSESNLTRKFEKIFKPAVLVGVFLALLLVGFCREARGEVTAEIGAPMLSGEYSKGVSLIITERWGGPYNSRYSVGMGYISEQEVTDRGENFHELRENLFIMAQRRVSFPIKGCPKHDCISLGLGPAYFNAITRWNGSRFVASLSIEFRPTEHWSVNFRHFSNAGSATPNMGQDMLTVGYTF
jgi:hypothetical protein